MPSQHQDIFAALCRPFPPDEIKRFKGREKKEMDYVTARTVMNRLDEVLGPENWWDDFVPLEHSVICRLTIRLPDGQVLTKSDAGGYAGMADQGDDEKSGFSDAFKRAAVKFGVGRHLYGDGIPRSQRPAPPPAKAPPREVHRAPEPGPPPGFQELPRPGHKDAYRWFRALGDHYRQDVVKMARDLGKAEGGGHEFESWSPELLTTVAIRAVRYCRRLPNYRGELDALAATLPPTPPAHPRPQADAPPPPPAPAGPDPLDRLKGQIIARSALLWTAEYPDRPFTDRSADEIAHAYSQGRVPSIKPCQDRAALEEVLKSVKEASDELQARRLPA